eukprot:Hpha_TRINITY_DN9605_c0_g1::TRINITY_DN9605_c0_g1_i1::g.184364::m.184364/K10582/UBE2Q; ubiquitin-conjugating enzyme E2 Q
MDVLEQWLDGDANDEYFYKDDETELPDGQVQVSVAGCFVFQIELASSRVLSVSEPVEDGGPPKSLRDPVKRWAAAIGTSPYPSLPALLQKATAEYKVIMDELQGSDDDDDGEAAAAASDAFVIDARADLPRKTPEEVEKEREFDIICDALSRQRTPSGTQAATERILADFKSIYLSKEKMGWDAKPREGNLYLWDITLFDFEKGTELWKDIEKLRKQRSLDRIECQIEFPSEYPFRPPFLRVLRPRFKPRTGRVTIGGSICHELLTNKGWKPINDITSIIVTLRAEITDPEANARIDFENMADYSEAEAREAFHRVSERYGWNK